MTSNSGSDLILDYHKKGDLGFDDGKRQRSKQDEKKIQEKIMEQLESSFKPEFLNRVDEIIIFHSLGHKEIAQIVELQIKRVQFRLDERKIKLEIDDSAKKYLAKKGYDPDYGARPLKRIIQNELMDELAMRIIEGKIKDGQKAKVSADKGRLDIK